MRGSTNAQTNHEGLYLPLSGGTVHNSSSTTPLTLKSGNQYYSFIGFTRSTGGTVYLGSFNGKPVFNDGSNHELAYKSDLESIQDQLTVDTVPTSGSSNLITSGAVYTAIQTLGEGYVSNQIVPLGVFEIECTVPVSKAPTWWGTTAYSLYNYSYNHTSTTTHKNSSGGLIQIKSSDTLSFTKNSGIITDYNTPCISIPSDEEFPSTLSFQLDLSHLNLPDGTYYINPIGGYKGVRNAQTGSDGWEFESSGKNTNFQFTFSPQIVTLSNGIMNIETSYTHNGPSGTSSRYLFFPDDSSISAYIIVGLIGFTEIIQQS